MKKNYVSPLVSEVNVEATESMLATSVAINKDTKVNREQQLNDERRGEWGNLWN